jgi:pyruvate dehydrogenase E1 component alpha subunit
MAVLPAERDLRRVIGEADGTGDREVDGLGEQELLELYRSMVLLRTYDERSVVYHRQGRIGTYAIFWNHEAMQVGVVHALDDEDWIFPSYRESAIGLLRGMPPATVLSWWRGHPAGLVEPRGLQRRVDLRADRDARATRRRSRVGQEAQG